MAGPFIINITNGQGSGQIINGTYDVTADVVGYDNLTIDPDSQIISTGIDTYNFTIAATGTLTLHVTEEGTSGGTDIQGATFVRCDSLGNPYGTPIISNVDGDAIFPNVPFAATNAPLIYYQQTSTISGHEFDGALKSVAMTTSTHTIEIANPEVPARTINLTDENYSGLPIESGEITFTEA